MTKKAFEKIAAALDEAAELAKPTIDALLIRFEDAVAAHERAKAERIAFTRHELLEARKAITERFEAQERALRESRATVSRVWAALGIETYEQAGGKEISEIVSALRKRLAECEGALEPLVEEFGCSIELYDKNGPDWTHKDGTEVFEVSTLLDRRELIDRARAALRAKGGE